MKYNKQIYLVYFSLKMWHLAASNLGVKNYSQNLHCKLRLSRHWNCTNAILCQITLTFNLIERKQLRQYSSPHVMNRPNHISPFLRLKFDSRIASQTLHHLLARNGSTSCVVTCTQFNLNRYVIQTSAKKQTTTKVICKALKLHTNEIPSERKPSETNPIRTIGLPFFPIERIFLSFY